MTSIADILSTTGDRLTSLGGPVDDHPLHDLHLVEDAADLTERCHDGLVLVPPRASQAAVVVGGYQLDVLLRQAAAHGVRGVAVAHTGEPVSSTALAIADRYAISLLGYREAHEFSSLALELIREIEGGAEQALLRLAKAAAIADAMAAADDSPQSIVDVIAQLTDAPLRLIEDDTAGREHGPTVDLVADDEHPAPASVVATALARAAVRQVVNWAERDQAAPLRSRAAIVSELLLGNRAPEESTIERAEALGIHLDGIHTVVVIDIAHADQLVEDPVREFELVEQIITVALRTLHSDSPHWHGTASGRRVLLARSLPPRDTTGSGARRLDIVQTLIDGLKERFPELQFRCGVGMAYDGVQGLRRSAAEAGAALSAAQSKGWADAVVYADAVGLRRMLLEFSASEASQALIDELLAPLDALGPAKTHGLVETLEIYLACQGSLVETAKRMYLHRNTVVHRVSRIKELLGTELDDPDHRFALQLACRVRRLGSVARL